tara:strand:+ start:59 stop:1024 length:966 start_codon:yes stop_codon:yes gene_type:complete
MKNELQKRISGLPVKPENLQKWILVGKIKLAAQIKAIKNISLLTDSIAACEAALLDTQDLAEELLYAESRLGSMLEKIPKQRVKQGSSKSTSLTSLPSGITKKQSHIAQELSRNEDVIAETVARARDKGEIPVRQHVLKAIQISKPKPLTPPLPKGKYDVIYADPPWKYGDEQNTDKLGGATKHYSLMSVEELCKMDVESLLPLNAVLFLWVTSPILPECFTVIEAWGFVYKASFVWDKIKHNMGHYNSVRHEFLLICTKGSFLPENKKLYDSVQSIERTKHSEKPKEFRKIIESLYPSGKKLELFARQQHKGWEAFGNEC